VFKILFIVLHLHFKHGFEVSISCLFVRVALISLLCTYTQTI